MALFPSNDFYPVNSLHLPTAKPQLTSRVHIFCVDLVWNLKKSQFYNSTAVMCFLGTLMFLKRDYANICRGQTNAQQTIHKIIKQRLVVFYFHSISIGFYFHSICVSLNISQALFPLSDLEVPGDTDCMPREVTFIGETHEKADAMWRNFLIYLYRYFTDSKNFSGIIRIIIPSSVQIWGLLKVWRKRILDDHCPLGYWWAAGCFSTSST